jgi:hypothetical protein
MKSITQDITFSIDMTTISKGEYRRLTAIAEALGDGQIHTYTYNKDGQDVFDKEQQDHLDNMYKED